MIEVGDLERSWELLGTSIPEEPEIRVRGAGIELPRGEVLLGIDREGNRHLLMPVAPASRIRVDEKSAGVRVGRRKLEEGGAKRTFVDLSCSMPHLFEHFDIIGREVLHEVATSDEVPDRVAIRVLERWRELLERDRRALPSVDRLIGLFGELLTLKRLLEHHAGATAWWLGPEGGRHDFVAPFGAVEVKTTRANDDWAVVIHGVGQLAGPSKGGLLLLVFKVEPHPEGRSIPDLVDVLMRELGDRPGLLEKLKAWGLDSRDLPKLGPYTFEVRETRAYEVTEEFPRIVEQAFKNGKLPSGVRTLEYTIDLSSTPPVPMPDDELNEALGSLAGADA